MDGGSSDVIVAGFGVIVILSIILPVVIEIGLAFLCAHIARKKGNSYAAWFILGLFFGLIALLIICCEPAKTEINKPNGQNLNNAAGQNSTYNQNQGYAQNQGFNQNPGGGQNGQAYQQNFNQNSLNIAATDAGNQNVKWRCNNCGYMNDPRARDCVICNQKRAGF